MSRSYLTGKRRLQISGSTLKLIAVTAMFLDHVGAVILEPLMMQTAVGGKIGFLTVDELYWLRYCLRIIIGRSAFPIFCFLLTEGMCRTGNRLRYLGRICIFALLSEVPFDLSLAGTVWNPSYQNVYFTLAVGLGTMILVDRLWSVAKGRFLSMLIRILCLIAGMGLAELLRTDYGGYGVLCILVLYLFRRERDLQLAAGAAIFPIGELFCYGTNYELTAVLGFIPIAMYNGERGWKMKMVFYVFYPLHLLVLYGVRLLLQIRV